MTTATSETTRPATSAVVMEKPLTGARTWRLPAIDGMRAMACMMVYAIHTWEFSGKPALPVHLFWVTIDVARFVESFPAGVDLFMVLSGFCLFWPMCKSEEALQKWSWQEYVWRRAKRICPPYYVAIAYVILFPQLLVVVSRMWGVQYGGHDPHFQPNPSAGNFIAHLLFVHTLSFSKWDGITGAFWSLGLEMQFYVVFPLVVYQFRRHRVWTLVGMIAVSILFRVLLNIVLIEHYQINETVIKPFGRSAADELQDVARLCNISFLGRWMQFAMGMGAAMLVAKYYRNHKLLSAWAGTGLLALTMALYAIVFSGAIDSLPWELRTSPSGGAWMATLNWVIHALAMGLRIFPTRDVLMGLLFSISLFAVSSSRSWARHVFEFKPIVFVGTISYSIFLIHQTTAWFFSELVRKKLYRQYDLSGDGSVSHYLLMLTVGLAVVLMVSYPYYLLFEKPFIANSSAKARNAAASAKPTVVSTPGNT